MSDDDEKPFDPEAARALAKVRRLMMVATATTFIAVAIVLGIIGYRVFHLEGRAHAVDASATLPAGAKVISTAVGDGRIVLTVEVAGVVELQTFDLNTLKPIGQLRLAPKP